MTRIADDNKELRAQLLDLQQKMGTRPGGGLGGGDGGTDAIMKAIDGSDQFKALRNGEIKTARINIPSAALHTKAITSTITGGSISQADRAVAIVAPSQRRLTIRNLLPAIPTSQGATEFVREASYSNQAGPQGGSSPIGTGEGEPKNASDMTFELVSSPIVTVAHHFTVSRQALDDSDALRQHIETRGIWGLQLEEEEEILTGNGGGGTLNGLVNNATAFTGGSTNLTRLDAVRKAITQVLKADHVPTGIVLNPTDSESLELAKDSQLRYMAVVVNVNGQPVVWRLPVVETNSMTLGRFLVADFMNAATIRDRQVATVEIGFQHSDYMSRNLALVLIEERIGLELHRPTAMVTGLLDYAG